MSTKLQAIALRKKGKSYNEISKALGVPKSTLSGWLSLVPISKAAQHRLDARMYAGGEVLIRRNKQQTIDAQVRAKHNTCLGSEEIRNIDKDTLRIVLAGLYWAEGYKKLKVRNGKEITSHVVSFVNADPIMARLFIVGLKRVLELTNKDIKVVMRLYENIDEAKALAYWAKELEMPVECFSKTTQLPSISSKRIKPFNTLPFGTVQILVQKTDVFYRIMGWIEGVKKQIPML